MNTFRKIGAVIAVFAAVFGLTWFFYYPHSPLGKQKAILKLAKMHKPVVEESLRRMTGAENVMAEVHTAGCLSIFGNVVNDQTAEVVINATLASRPPVTVMFSLIVGETNVVHKIVEPH